MPMVARLSLTRPLSGTMGSLPKPQVSMHSLMEIALVPPSGAHWKLTEVKF